MNVDTKDIRLGQSTAAEAPQAAREFHEAVAQPDMELVLFFCSSEYDLEALAAEINRLFADVQVVGCTTAGEIGSAGYLQHSLSGVSFSRRSFSVASGVLKELQHFEISDGHEFVQALLQKLENKAPQAKDGNTFAFMMIDGMSMREELVAHSLQSSLGNIALFGGSAGDDQKFSRSYVFCDGQFHPDSAALLLVNTPLPFQVFKTQHFTTGDERLVVTDADSTRRLVREINGLPAAEEYARIVGVDVSELGSMMFAASPVVVLIDGTDYVRSIQKVNPDGSLTFYCAIEEGVVFRVAHGAGLLENLQQTIEDICARIGPPQLIIGCDCILRNLEVTQAGLKDRVWEILNSGNTVGFSSYGEQYQGIHVNQTFTGIAIGTSPTSRESTADD